MKRGTARQIHSAWAWASRTWKRYISIGIAHVQCVFMSLVQYSWALNTRSGIPFVRNVMHKMAKTQNQYNQKNFYWEISLKIRYEKYFCENMNSDFYSFSDFWNFRFYGDGNRTTRRHLVWIQLFSLGTSTDCDVCFSSLSPSYGFWRISNSHLMNKSAAAFDGCSSAHVFHRERERCSGVGAVKPQT